MSVIKSVALIGLLLSIFTGLMPAGENNYMNVYVGTYMRMAERGIFMFKLNFETGEAGEVELAGKAINPSFLAIHQNHKYLYAVNEISSFKKAKTGAVSSFAIDPVSGKLNELNQQPSGGEVPCHLVVDPSGKNVLLASYTGGSIEVLPIEADGKMGEPTCVIKHKDPENKGRASHCHSINLDMTGKFAFVADLGLDRVFLYKFDAEKGVLTPNDPAALVLASGAGPRHFAWHTSRKFAYVINELNSTITAVSFDAEKGTLAEIQTLSTLPEGFTGKSYCAEVVVHPSGKFLYGSNRGHDSIAIFGVDEATGKLKLLGHEPTQGKVPRNFALDPSGKYLLAANQDSNNIVIFRIDEATGLLKSTGQKIKVSAPACIKFLSSN